MTSITPSDPSINSPKQCEAMQTTPESITPNDAEDGVPASPTVPVAGYVSAPAWTSSKFFSDSM